MFEKEPNVSIARMEKITEAFYAPDDSMHWWEKLGGHLSAASRHNLIDMAFTDQSYELRRMKNFMAGWYYYDAAVIFLIKVVRFNHDLRTGYWTISLTAMRAKKHRT